MPISVYIKHIIRSHIIIIGAVKVHHISFSVVPVIGIARIAFIGIIVVIHDQVTLAFFVVCIFFRNIISCSIPSCLRLIGY